MADVCARLGGVSIDAFEESRFVRPQSVHYELDGERRRWCALHSRRACRPRCPAYDRPALRCWVTLTCLTAWTT